MSSALLLLRRAILVLFTLHCLCPALVLGRDETTQGPATSTQASASLEDLTTLEGPTPTEDVSIHFYCLRTR